ncbi:MAG: hypothetical protein EOM21_13155 [Gammaproteobacteria bacterium]|nr:hypothetical protein [Gammaproteobacteria bacterium]
MTSPFVATETFTADASRTFGVEIEFLSSLPAETIAAALTDAGIETVYEGYNHATRNHWKIVTDATVRGVGWELVSPPMRFDATSFAAIETVSRVLTGLGCRIDRRCGLHVHHYAADLGVAKVGKILALYAKHEAWIDAMMPKSRRGNDNSMIRSLNVARDVARTVEAFAACRTRADLEALLPNRYHKVNPAALWRHGTLEFRQHSGTIEAAKIINWVQITRALLEKGAKAKSVDSRGEPNYHRFFRLVCGKELAAYIRTRTAALAA